MDYEISGKCENIDYIHENGLSIWNYFRDDCSFMNFHNFFFGQAFIILKCY